MSLNQLVKIVISALEDVKASDIEVLDVTKMTTLFDRMIIASAASTRQAKAIANNVHDKVKASGGLVYGTEGEDSGEWMLVDLGDILVHIMLPAVRAHYDLEGLWGELKTEMVDQKMVDQTKNKPALGSNRLLVN
ncbi:MAG: ribosome silencing factor [Nitrosomonadaceae bacterium]